jgi:glucose/arabinose dehydrogenase
VGRLALGLGFALLLAACGNDQRAYEVVAEGFQGPTQVARGPDGLLLVAQLAGGEDDRTGEVVALDRSTGDRTVIVRGLDKPTGVAWVEGHVWVMVRRGLVRVPWSGPDTAPGAIETILRDLPFNGRSEGTLTVLPDGRLVHETSGSVSGDDPTAAEPGGGRLWAIDPGSLERTELASGLKNAYAHAVTKEGDLLVSDINDTRTPPPDELNLLRLSTGAPDFGWPTCDGDHTGPDCAGVTPPVASFAPRSTPTGVTVVDDVAYVALHVEGRVVRVGPGDGSPGSEVRTVLDGLDLPHTVLGDGDGLLVTEHGTGRLLRVRLDGPR